MSGEGAHSSERIPNCINKLKKCSQKTKLGGAGKKDIEWWHEFISEFNGVATFIDEKPVSPILTDSCGIAGGAVFENGDFCYIYWEHDFPKIAKLHINYKEAAVAALSVLRWGHFK